MEDSKNFIPVIEQFESIQGEGRSVGCPALFLRFAGCNLNCTWCDTDHSIKNEKTKFKYPSEIRNGWDIDISQWFMKNKSGIMVITGGEPLLRWESIKLVLSFIYFFDHKMRDVEIETNGTINPMLLGISVGYFNIRYNCSPKLEYYFDWNLEYLHAFMALGASFKFVAKDENEVARIFEIRHKDLKGYEDIYIMPNCKTRVEFNYVAPVIAKACLKYGFKFGSRLHINIWDNKKGI